ncbi:MAG: glycosyltransferase [Bacteroidetes bacterium]|nr:glycosyltransferase [Bacteroidota bacterium]
MVAWYAVVVLLVMLAWLALMLAQARGQRHAAHAPPMAGPWPSISIIVPAMNEEDTIQPAMRTLMALDYPNLQVVAVDDRSTDATGAILDRMALEYPERLRVSHITELPSGWLGKCNALQHGAAMATGSWLLFTDADVLFQPATLRGAMAFAVEHAADHVVYFPRMLWHGIIEASLLSFFSMVFTLGFQTWRAESGSRRAYVGVGAFNLVRRSTYDRFGGHQALRLEVADDLMLGYLVKKHGGRTLAVNAGEDVRVRWRLGARDTVRGLERSGFAGLGFSIVRVAGTVAGTIGVLLAPYILPFVVPVPAVVIPSIAAIGAIVAAYAVNRRVQHFPVWIGLLHPVACTLFVYAFVRSAVMTSARGGLSWRGTFYSIAELKAGRVR